MTDQEYNKAIDLLLGRNNELKVDYLNFHQMEVIRFMEQEMPTVLEDYLQEIRRRQYFKCKEIGKEYTFTYNLIDSLDLRNLVAYLVEHPEWGERTCPIHDTTPTYHKRGECRFCYGSGKITHPALEYARGLK